MAAQHLPSECVELRHHGCGHGPRRDESATPDTPRSPASTIKTVTTFAALDMLGPAFIWQTRAWLAASMAISLSARRRRSVHHAGTVVELRAGLRATGLEVDSRATSSSTTAHFPCRRRIPGAFDGRPNRSYNVVPDALMVNFQSIDFRLAAECRHASSGHYREPGSGQSRGGKSHSLRARPLRRCGGESGFSRLPRRSGTGWFFPAPCPRTARREAFARACCSRPPMLSAPSSSCGANREASFEANCASSRRRPTPNRSLTFDSLSLAEIVRLTNKHSSNLMARHLLLTLGTERYGASGDPGKGHRRHRGVESRTRLRLERRGYRQWIRSVAQHADYGAADGEDLERRLSQSIRAGILGLVSARPAWTARCVRA